MAAFWAAEHRVFGRGCDCFLAAMTWVVLRLAAEETLGDGGFGDLMVRTVGKWEAVGVAA